MKRKNNEIFMLKTTVLAAVAYVYLVRAVRVSSAVAIGDDPADVVSDAGALVRRVFNVARDHTDVGSATGPTSGY